MSADRLLFALALASAFLTRALAGEPAPAPAEGSFARAIAEYEVQRFPAAFEALARLADSGHPEAARIALLMHAHGPRLFGQRFEVDATRRSRWVDAALIEFKLAASPRP